MIKNQLRKLKFQLGFDPKIEKSKHFSDFIPKPYQSVLLISADFELAWAWRYTKSSEKPIEKALREARQERENIPLLVNLFEKYQIPITWLTVGHLFLESCKRENGQAHEHIKQLAPFESEYWKYNGKDWFEHDPCTSFKGNPEWYCPDLLKIILNSKIKHEIGCHTFSHIDCSDAICPPEVFNDEIDECKLIANKWNLDLKSFVHPAHSIGNLDSLAKQGFTNFRTDYSNTLGFPVKHSNGLWEIKQTTEFRYYEHLRIDEQIQRYIAIIKRAIKSNTIASIWFHPSIHPIFVSQIFPEVLKFINENQDKVWVTTHKEFIDNIKK